MKPVVRRSVLGLLLLSAGAVALWGDRTPAGSTAKPSAARVTTSGAVRPSDKQGVSSAAPAASAVEMLVLQDRRSLIARGPNRNGPQARGLFAGVAPVKALAPPASAAAAPAPPPMPFAYLGRQFDGHRWQVFLKREKGDVVVVKEGDEVDGLYRVASIAPQSMTLLYVPLMHSHTLTID